MLSNRILRERRRRFYETTTPFPTSTGQFSSLLRRLTTDDACYTRAAVEDMYRRTIAFATSAWARDAEEDADLAAEGVYPDAMRDLDALLDEAEYSQYVTCLFRHPASPPGILFTCQRSLLLFFLREGAAAPDLLGHDGKPVGRFSDERALLDEVLYAGTCEQYRHEHLADQLFNWVHDDTERRLRYRAFCASPDARRRIDRVPSLI